MGFISQGITGALAPAAGSLAGGVLGGVTGGLAEGTGLNPAISAQQAQLVQSPDLVGNIQNSQGQINEAQTLLRQQIAGEGPNPALEQLKMTTNRNQQQAAGMVASQKGVNPALAARLAGQQDAYLGQEAAGQGATLRAQQILGAQQQFGSNAMGQQQTLQQALAAQNQSSVANQEQQNKYNTELEKERLSSRGKLAGGLLQGAGSAASGGAAHGGIIGGEANVEGDSPENDTVPARLSPGEIVVPRSAAKSPDKAKAFIDALMKGNQDDEPEGYARVLKSHRELEKRIKKLEGKKK